MKIALLVILSFCFTSTQAQEVLHITANTPVGISMGTVVGVIGGVLIDGANTSSNPTFQEQQKASQLNKPASSEKGNDTMRRSKSTEGTKSPKRNSAA